jgi:hypothetical protein
VVAVLLCQKQAVRASVRGNAFFAQIIVTWQLLAEHTLFALQTVCAPSVASVTHYCMCSLH